jgi:hypothetical protein
MKVEQDTNLSPGASGETIAPGRRRRPRATRNVTSADEPRVGRSRGAATRSGRQRPIVPIRSISWRRRPKTGFPTSCRSATRV